MKSIELGKYFRINQTEQNTNTKKNVIQQAIKRHRYYLTPTAFLAMQKYVVQHELRNR